jgi:murein DD-endopeptidase MepM/ murein hydrolase activator NlpD
MPTVPLYRPDQNWVQPNEAQLRAPDISSGLEAVSQGLGHVADVTNQIVQMSSETQARAQALQDSQALSKLTAQYQTLQGQNAVDAQADTLKQIKALQDQGMASMGTPLMQRYYVQHAAPIFAGANDAVYGHAVQQTHVAFGNQLTAERSAAQDTVAGLYQDVDKLADGLGVVADKARSEAIFQGLGDPNGDAVREYVKNKTGEVISGAIHNALSSDVTADGKSGVDLAIDLNNRFGGDKLPFAIQQQVEAAMKEPLLNREAAAYVAAAKNGTALPVKGDDGHWIIPPSDPTAQGDAPSSDTASPGFQMPVAGKIGQTVAQHKARGSEGIDIPVPLGTPVKAPAQGTVARTGYDPRSGNFVVIDHPDGSTSTLAHFSNVQVKPGDQVNANTVLGASGQSGDATGPHVHWQLIDKNDKYVDPASMVGGKPGAVAAVTSPGGLVVPDEAKVLANIDAMNLPPEMATRVKALASQQFKQARTAETYQFEQASQNATEWVANWALAHNNEYPPATAIPPAILNKMRPDEAAELQLRVNKAREGDIDQAQSQAQSKRYADLQVMRYADPDRFLAINPKDLIGQVSAGQWNEIRVTQAQMRAKDDKEPKAWDPYKGAYQAFATFQKLAPEVLPPAMAKTDPNGYAQSRAALLEGVRTGAEALSKANGGRAPTPVEWQALVRNAASMVSTPKTFFGIPTGTTQKPAFAIKASEIDKPTRKTIIAGWRASHPSDPTDADIVEAYQRLHALRALRQ